MKFVFRLVLFLSLTIFLGDMVVDLLQHSDSISLVDSSEDDTSDDEEKSDDTEDEEETNCFKELDLFFETESEYQLALEADKQLKNRTEFTSCPLSHATNPPFLPPDLTV